MVRAQPRVTAVFSGPATLQCSTPVPSEPRCVTPLPGVSWMLANGWRVQVAPVHDRRDQPAPLRVGRTARFGICRTEADTGRLLFRLYNAGTCQRRRDYVPARRRKNCTTGSVVACPRSPWEGPARAGRRALCAAGGGPRVGGAYGPTGTSGGLFGRALASRSALPEPVAVCVHLQDMDMVGDAVEQRAGEALAGEHRCPFLEGQV